MWEEESGETADRERENLVQEGRRQGMQLQREGSRDSLRGLEYWVS